MKDIGASLYEYYMKAGVNPVYAGFSSSKDLEEYDRSRRRMFEYNLRLPISAFERRTLLEFGPASGENALVFAKWGARLTLVEPVRSFVEVLNDYFDIYGLKKQIVDIECLPIENYRTEKKYDFVIAEGFIFQIGGPEYWIPLLLSFAKDDGFVFLSYTEMAGYLIDIIQAKSFQVIFERRGGDPYQLARRMYQKKWDSVPHVRKFESWVDDNLRNPLIGRNILNTLSDLQGIMAGYGIFLWSSWPSVFTQTDVKWIKATFDPTEELARCRQAYIKLIPSLIMGKIVPTTDAIFQLGSQILDKLREELRILGTHVKNLNEGGLSEAICNHRDIETLFSETVLDYSQTEFFSLWRDMLDCLCNLESQQDDKVIEMFCGEGPLSKYWGSPNCYTVWHRFPASK